MSCGPTRRGCASLPPRAGSRRRRDPRPRARPVSAPQRDSGRARPAAATTPRRMRAPGTISPGTSRSPGPTSTAMRLRSTDGGRAPSRRAVEPKTLALPGEGSKASPAVLRPRPTRQSARHRHGRGPARRRRSPVARAGRRRRLRRRAAVVCPTPHPRTPSGPISDDLPRPRRRRRRRHPLIPQERCADDPTVRRTRSAGRPGPGRVHLDPRCRRLEGTPGSCPAGRCLSGVNHPRGARPGQRQGARRRARCARGARDQPDGA